MLTKDAATLAKRIREWELNVGESFTDYYMDDRVKEVSWAFWLLGKGYKERANVLIDMITNRESIDQQLKFEVHLTSGDWNEEFYLKDIALWAEFLTASDRYFKDISEWFEDNQ